MSAPIDISTFQLEADPDQNPEDFEEEITLLEDLRGDARAYVESRPWAPPVAELLLAFGVGGILGLFLVRFAHDINGETERWIVVGDLPWMNFETENAPTPDVALRLYCAICEDWAENILKGRSLTDSYPIPVDPTKEHADMLMGRVEFIRDKIVPLAASRTASKSISGAF
ncbi:MAG TPA: hypothetical protein VL358_08830 [Caulobacteraceae bacterium]|jgi:hypothetical protein|nr:hypothetical protein [Caulobacteraceae bacterium]